MRTAALVTVRTDSTRLPRKCFLPLNGKPVIQHIIERSRMIEADEIIVCTTDRPVDDYLAAFCSEFGVQVFRGSLDDKYGRWLGACDLYGIDAFVNVDADDPLFDFELMKIQLGYNTKGSESLPVGCITISMTRNKLFDLIGNQQVCFDETYGVIQSFNHYRLTLDYQEDYAFFDYIFKKLDIVKNTRPTFDLLQEIDRIDPRAYLMNEHKAKEWKERQLAEAT